MARVIPGRETHTPKSEAATSFLVPVAEIDSIEVITLGLYNARIPSVTSENSGGGMFMPPHFKSNKSGSDLDFEWLLCLASALDMVKRGLVPRQGLRQDAYLALASALDMVKKGLVPRQGLRKDTYLADLFSTLETLQTSRQLNHKAR